VPRRDRQTIGLFQRRHVYNRFDLIKHIGTESNHLEGVGAESNDAEQAIVPNRLLP
jgi:hypothetical protein